MPFDLDALVERETAAQEHAADELDQYADVLETFDERH